jgi:hypothetical protein
MPESLSLQTLPNIKRKDFSPLPEELGEDGNNGGKKNLRVGE